MNDCPVGLHQDPCPELIALEQLAAVIVDLPGRLRA